MTYKYLLLTLFLSVFLTACGGSSSSPAPVDDPNDETPDPNDDDHDDDDDDDTNGDDDDTANGDDDEATAAGLVAHYLFNDNLEDATGNFGEGQITGDVPDSEGGSITYAAGAVDGSTAAVFDGTSGVDLGEGLIGPGDYSLSIWLHPDELGQFVPAFFGQSGPNSWVSLVPGGGPGGSEDTMLWAGDGDGTGWFDGTIGSQIPVGDWSHLVFTYSAGELNAYLNGELAMSHTGFPNVFSTDGASFHLGVNPFPDAPYTGLIDDLRIYDVALTAEQVAAVNAGEEIEVDPDQISDDEDDDANGDDDGANGDDDGANGDDDDGANGDDDGANGGDETLATGLVAHFLFNDNLEDATGTFADGQITGDAPGTEGGAITYAGGAVDGSTAAVFDGTSGVQLAEGLIGQGDYTLSIWLHPDEVSQFVPAFFGQSGPDSWVSLVPAGPGDDQHTMLWAGNGDGTGWFDGTIGSQIPAGDWSHLVFTYSNGDMNAYLNGELAVAHTGFPNVFFTDSASFHLAVNPFPDAPYTGMIDDLRIYDRALSAEEVSALAGGNN